MTSLKNLPSSALVHNVNRFLPVITFTRIVIASSCSSRFPYCILITLKLTKSPVNSHFTKNSISKQSIPAHTPTPPLLIDNKTK